MHGTGVRRSPTIRSAKGAEVAGTASGTALASCAGASLLARVRVVIVASAASALVWAVLFAASAQPAYANSGTITPNGPPVTAIISTPNVPATFTFSGTAGEVVTASAFAGTFTNGCDVSLQLLGAGGVVLASTNCVGQSGFMPELTLPGSATYKLKLAPNSAHTGRVSLTLSANRANSTIAINGAAVTFTASHTGQGQDFTFSGSAGEVITASAFAGTFTNGCDLSMQILGSGGSVVANSGVSCMAQSGFMSELTLPGTGTYTLDVLPNGSDIGHNTGHVSLTLSANRANSTIAINGAAVTFTTSHTGQGQDFTFSGSAGEVITASAFAGTFTNGCDLSMQILGSGGSVVANSGVSCMAQSGFMSELTLPGTGTYTLDVLPNGSDIGHNTGHVSLTLSANRANSTIAINGAAVTFTTSHTGQGQDFTFSGSAGEVITASAFAGTFTNGCDLSMQILGSGGSVVANSGVSCMAQSGSSGKITLPATGTYILDVFPNGSNAGHNTGHVSVALKSP